MTAERLRSYFALERDIVVVSAGMLLLGFGEQLWKKFTPKFLETLGAPILGIGLYGTIQDTLDGLYQYPGGWLSDRLGRRRALILFTALATVGYAIYAGATLWPLIYVGLAFVMAWQSMGNPTYFAIIGDALPPQQRAMGFTVLSILRRLPTAIAPILGGLMIARLGTAHGFRLGAGVAVVAGIATMLLSTRLVVRSGVFQELRGLAVWQALPPRLKKLLVSDIFARTCEGLVDVFLVLYALDVVGISATQFGFLIFVQMMTSIIIYIPAARRSDRGGREPLVAFTFLAFALFPLAVVFSRSFPALILAYVIAGLRELGEPSRKALIVDLVDAHLRGRSVGLYYLIRSLAIAPAALLGGLLWKISPAIPFYLAAVVGAAGTLVFLWTSHEKRKT